MSEKISSGYIEKTRSTLARRLTSFAVLLSAIVLVIVSASIIVVRKFNLNEIIIIAIGTFGLLFVWAGFWRYSRNLTAPITDLIQFTEQANLKRLGARLEINTGDEFQDLARAINLMMQRLDSSMKRIQQLAFVDTVTELPNRKRFKQEADEALKACIAGRETGAVISLDVDRFLSVQNTLGQVIGGELLGLVSDRLAAAVRASDSIVRLEACKHKPALLARTNGSEFAILVPNVKDPTEAGRFAQLVAAALRQPFELQHHRIVLGASAGISVFPQDGEIAEEIIRSAELAMSHARNSGGGRSVFFTRKLNQRALSKLVLENEIRYGIEHGQFVPHFQPKVDLGTGRISGCEALVRWEHPKYGLVSPGKFIQAAEESGLIGPMGDLVMRESARRAAEWLRRGLALRVAVNVSSLQFNNDNFTQSVVDVLNETNLPPSLFELEITESIAMSDPDRVQRMLEPLRLKGVRIAIDDFGTGHSNLSSLTSLPFDVFKIDQSFVHALGKDKHAPALIETIIAMAGGLNYETVAEGVETQEQAAFLKKRGATLGQGYLFGKPMPAAEFEEYARAWANRGGGLPMQNGKLDNENIAAISAFPLHNGDINRAQT